MRGNGVAAIREGASVSAAIIILQLGYPFRRQGGIDVIGRVLVNATQRSGRMREAPQKRGHQRVRVGWGFVHVGVCRGTTLARQADRRVFARADHTFTLERACDAGIGAARGLKRRLSIRDETESCQKWGAVLALCVITTGEDTSLPLESNSRVSVARSRPLECAPPRPHGGCTRRHAAHEAQGHCGRGRELGRRRHFSQPRCRSWGIELFCRQRSVLYRCLKAHPAWSDASQTDGDGSACQGAGDGRPRASLCGLGHR